MKILVGVDAGELRRALLRAMTAAEEAALDAAADALADEFVRSRERNGLHAPLTRTAGEGRRFVGTDDPESFAREFGTQAEPPAPWLAPALPVALARMRREAAVRRRR